MEDFRNRINLQRKAAWEELRSGALKPWALLSLVGFSLLAAGSLILQLFWVGGLIALWLGVVGMRVVLWLAHASLRSLGERHDPIDSAAVNFRKPTTEPEHQNFERGSKRKSA